MCFHRKGVVTTVLDPLVNLSGRYAIIGVAESDLGVVGNRTELSLQVQAAQLAIEDAGIDKNEIDGVFVQPGPFERMPSLLLSEYLGLKPRVSDTTMIGGCSNLAHIAHAMAAMEAGLCNTALIVYSSTQRSAGTRQIGGWIEDPRSPRGQFDVPYGLLSPIGCYALTLQRHMHLYGTTPEQLGEIAIATRQWALLNPKAYRRNPLTMDEYLSSPFISEPLRREDICLLTDGGGAVIVTRRENVPAGKPAVVIEGIAEQSSHHYWVPGIDDLLEQPVVVETGRRAFAMAGLTHDDIDVLQIYDAFTVMPLLAVEALGFCGRGEGGKFFEGGRTAPGGPLPMNTSGGGLSYCHPGMFGIFLVIEAVRQLRGECGQRQVPNPRHILCQSFGGQWSASVTMILGRD